MGRALLIEESADLRAAYADFLQKRGLDVFTARGVSDARALLPALKPDVTTLDVDLEQGDGLGLIENVTAAGSRCLVISTRADVRNRIDALSRGADDYLAKPVDLEELYLRMRNMMAARMPQAAGASGAIVDFHGVKVDLVTRAILNRSGRPGPELTETELSLLRLLTENMDRVVAKESLFSAIYARPYAPGTRSLDVGVSRLRIKLRSTDVGAEIRSVREAGYMFSLERDSVASARAG